MRLQVAALIEGNEDGKRTVNDIESNGKYATVSRQGDTIKPVLQHTTLRKEDVLPDFNVTSKAEVADTFAPLFNESARRHISSVPLEVDLPFHTEESLVSEKLKSFSKSPTQFVSSPKRVTQSSLLPESFQECEESEAYYD